VPNYRASALAALPYIDIAHNSVSFPEMSAANVREYLGLTAPKLRRFFWSVNYRSGDNSPVGTDDYLAEYFELFPSRQDYRAWAMEGEYDGLQFRPTFVGTTPACAPLGDVTLRMAGPHMGRLTVRKVGEAVSFDGLRPGSQAQSQSSTKRTITERLRAVLGF
jgi:hypothetical protein